MEARDISRSRVAPFEISLRIRHPSIDPNRISRELKVEPEHCFKAGEPRESSSGIAVTSVHAESYWLGSLTGLTSTTSLMSGLNIGGSVSSRRAKSMRGAPQLSLGVALETSILAFLRPHAEFIRQIQCEEGQICLLIELATETLSGFALSPQCTRVLSDLGVALEFDFVSS
jgi:hypothetical protein